jgi:hypothetical protein
VIKLIIAVSALFALTFPSQAKQVAAIKPPAIKPLPIYYPPAEFDRPYTKTLTIIDAKDADEVKKARGNVPATMGCSLRWADRCTIVLAPESIMKSYGWTEEHVLRHGIAHCNGWHGDHRGWSLTDPWKR